MIRIGDGLTAWLRFKGAERWMTEDEVIAGILQHPPIAPPAWIVPFRTLPMNRLINRPDPQRIARDLALGLMIAGAVVLFF